MLRNLLAFAKTYPAWVTNSFPIIKLVLVAIIAVAAISIIVVIFAQNSSSSGGTNVLSGEIESYYSQNKGQSREGKLKKLTVILSSIIAASTVIYFILTAIY